MKTTAAFAADLLGNIGNADNLGNEDPRESSSKVPENKLEIERKKVDAFERKAKAKQMQAKAIQVEAKVKAMKEFIELGFTKEDAFDHAQQMFGC
ncbi:hypothetical protein EC973_004560 [Apophysomyces ossiformis]|uniref:Uncharacterized protein n=1 Tax=Apophysomyces ossiformis TaxID=679940 RepID=A0A8H7ESF5_9FUNG|nr:hypothetical protein EC973_004560 [Apophysomyces ossiformis]